MKKPGCEFLVFDGDQIGDRLAKIYLSNCEDELRSFDLDLRDRMARGEQFLRTLGLDMIAAGADGITCKGQAPLTEQIFRDFGEIAKPYSFSMGCGATLRDAFVALRFAKASGRGRWARMARSGEITLGQ